MTSGHPQFFLKSDWPVNNDKRKQVFCAKIGSDQRSRFLVQFATLEMRSNWGESHLAVSCGTVAGDKMVASLTSVPSNGPTSDCKMRLARERLVAPMHLPQGQESIQTLRNARPVKHKNQNSLIVVLVHVYMHFSVFACMDCCAYFCVGTHFYR